MKLTQTLIERLYRGFDRDPKPFLALRVDYAGQMAWAIADRTLTLVGTGGIGDGPISIDLSAITIAQLAATIAGLPGYSVLYQAPVDQSSLSAMVLLDGTGTPSASNGDHITGYSALVWAYEDALAVELTAAAYEIDQMLLQMSPASAEVEWLDLWGGYFGIPRRQSEPDRQYSMRMIVEVLRPRGNNVAMEAIISEALGQPASVTDVVGYVSVSNTYNAAATHNAAINYSGGTAIPRYALFDVAYAYDLLSADAPVDAVTAVTDLINRIRDAGTQLRSLVLTGSKLEDAAPVPTTDDISTAITLGLADSAPAVPADGLSELPLQFAPLSDTAIGADSDALVLTMGYAITYDGTRKYNGKITHAGVSTAMESL